MTCWHAARSCGSRALDKRLSVSPQPFGFSDCRCTRLPPPGEARPSHTELPPPLCAVSLVASVWQDSRLLLLRAPLIALCHRHPLHWAPPCHILLLCCCVRFRISPGLPGQDASLFQGVLNVTAGLLGTASSVGRVAPARRGPSSVIIAARFPQDQPLQTSVSSDVTPTRRCGRGGTRVAPGAPREALAGPESSPLRAPSPGLRCKVRRKRKHWIRFFPLSHLLANEWHHLTLFWKERFQVVLKTEGKIQMFEC